jgi:hypothetical protein
MARIKGLIPPQSSRFVDTYDIYVDYGKGQPIKMNDNESILYDVEKFLLGQNDHTKLTITKKSNGITRRNSINSNKSIIRNNYRDDLSVKSEHP